MAEELTPSQSQATPALPDINAETHPFDIVLYNLNKAAYFNMFTTLGPRSSPDSPSDPYDVNGGFVLNLGNDLHRFKSVVAPVSARGVKVEQSIGNKAGTLRGRWLFAPEDFEWDPSTEPPPVLYDPFQSQRFMLQELHFKFDDSSDGFRVYGMGQTFPVELGGETRTLAGAVGTIMEGYGEFEGLEGTVTFNGVIAEDRSFRGDVSVRVLDWDRKLTSDGDLPGISGTGLSEDATYLVMRGQKKNKYALTTYAFGPNGMPEGINTPAEIRSANYNFADLPGRGLRGQLSTYQIIGNLKSRILFNILETPGTNEKPTTFETRNHYTYTDCMGNVVGTIQANVVLGRSFNLVFPSLPGQQGIRYGGVGPIVEATGQFAGIQGLVMVNSVVGVAPHALSLQNILRIVGPAGGS